MGGGCAASPYELANRLVADTPPDDAPLVFLPFLFGSNAQPDAKACLVGLGAWHGRGHVLRAIYEGVVFGHKAHFDRLLRFRDPPRAIRLAGGASRSDVWTRIFADVFQTPVEIPAGTELGALGAAICAAVAVGCYGSYQEAVGAMVRLSKTQQPDTTRADLYAAKRGQYQKVLAALGPVWKELVSAQ
jgi:L-xylulokinase